MFSRYAFVLISALGLVGLMPKAAHAAVVYDLTLTATSGGTINGSGTFTVSSAPLTGFNQQSSYFQTQQPNSGVLSAFSITIGGDVFNFANESNGSNPFVRFTAGALDTVNYTGKTANGDSLQINSSFVFFQPAVGQQEFGNFSASVHVSPAVPETSTWAMMILGFFGLAVMASRRRNSTMRVA